jgi:RNA polymerase sigma factor (sigma-70 family)
VTVSDIIAVVASTIRDADTRQDAIVAMLDAGEGLTLAEAETIARRARYRASWARYQQRTRSISLELIREPEPEQTTASARAHVASAYALLALLPEDQRRAFILRHASGYSINAIAETMNVHRSTVWTWLRAARKTIAANMRMEAQKRNTTSEPLSTISK